MRFSFASLAKTARRGDRGRILIFAMAASIGCKTPSKNDSSQSMYKNIISTNAAPKAIGPYSQAVEIDGFVFSSGQIALDPESGQLTGSDAKAQTQQVLRNLRAVLAESGCTFENVVKTTVYLADMNDFAAMNEVYATAFSNNPPARSTIQAAKLPRGALVEIDVIARRIK